MTDLRIISWNVNGLRAICRKGFLDWFAGQTPDILCLQETKALPEQFPPELKQFDQYHLCTASAQRRGYSGVALWSRLKPRRVRVGLGIEKFDAEGRTLIADYEDFRLYNIYFPNGGASPERLSFKLEFYDALLDHLRRTKRRQPNIIICGDVNTAHREIDLARPRENATVSGFLPEERAWIDRLLDAGFLDTFRLFDDSPDRYTWWDYKTRARERNVGWRIDYFFATKSLQPRLKNCTLHPETPGSDHCPVALTLAPASPVNP